MKEIRAIPTPEILRWAEDEVGLFFHYDIEVFDPEWQFGSARLPAPDCWRPEKLDTDQWIDTAKKAGARYALMTAKHSTGFCLWPTKVHDYHVGNTPVPTDVVGAFVKSCRKAGIRPGIYYSLSGAHLEKLCRDGRGELDRERMNRMLLAQIRELVENYGPFCEMWFDGGVRRPEKGGPDVAGLLAEIAPEMVCFGGCPGIRNVLRWSGSEQGIAVPECWSAAHWLTEPERDNVTCDAPGDPFDEVFAPVEVDMPVRDVMYAYKGGWFWHAQDADKTYSGEYLFERYLTSVGRNANLLIGCLPGPDGLISPDQVQSFADFGALVRQRFGKALAETETAEADGSMEIFLEQTSDIGWIVLEEDQTRGQRILSFTVETRWPDDWCRQEKKDGWIPVCRGQSVGHKRIIRIGHLNGYAFRVRVTESAPGARLKAFRLYGEPCPFRMTDHPEGITQVTPTEGLKE